MRLTTVLLFILLASQSFAQEPHLYNNLLGVKFGLGFSPALKINQEPHLDADGNKTGYGLFSAPSPGIHGKVSYALQIRSNSFLELGILVGNESIRYVVRADRDFKQWEGAVFPFKATSFAMEYFGLSLQLQHHFPLSERFGIFGGIGVSGVFFVPWRFEFLYSVSRELFGESDLVFFSWVQVNDKEQIFYKLDLDLGFYHKIGSRFLLRPSISYSYSRNTILESIDRFRIFGDSEIITGTVSRKLRNVNLNASFYVNF